MALAAHIGSGSTVDAGLTAAMAAGCAGGAFTGASLAPRFSHEKLARSFALLVAAAASYSVLTVFL
jgi:uncharacterized membrane protein YfcA